MCEVIALSSQLMAYSSIPPLLNNLVVTYKFSTGASDIMLG